MALFPYLLVIVVFAIAKLIAPVKEWLSTTDVKIPWPGLSGEVLTIAGTPSAATTYTLSWLSSPGTMLLICSLIVAFVYGIGLTGWGAEAWATAHKMRYAFLTVASMLALAYVMNFSGQTITIGTWIAATAGIDPTLLVAANTSGGVVGKMISPQNLTIAATAVGLVGRESDILRKVLPWSIGLIIAVCLLVGLQSTVLAWMLP